MRIGSYEITFEQFSYRVRQFVSVVRPKVDQSLVNEAGLQLPKEWRTAFFAIPAATMAHVLRLYQAIRADTSLEEGLRSSLLILALTHDIGKGVTRPTLFERVMKVILPLPNKSHVIAGSRLMKLLGAPPDLVKRIRRHHEPPESDQLLALFQTFDDRL